jgi:hypothetical protein
MGVRPGNILRARGRCEGCCVSVRTNYRRGWRHGEPVLWRGRFLCSFGYGQHSQDARLAGIKVEPSCGRRTLEQSRVKRALAKGLQGGSFLVKSHLRASPLGTATLVLLSRAQRLGRKGWAR